MKKFNFKLETSGDSEFYRMYLTVMNFYFNLTDKEISVLAELYNEKNELLKVFANREADDIVFSNSIRKKIYDKLEMTTFNFNNYIGNLKDKKIILKDQKGLSLNSKFFIKKEDTQISFSLLIKKDEDTGKGSTEQVDTGVQGLRDSVVEEEPHGEVS